MKFVLIFIVLVAIGLAEIDPKLSEFMLQCSTEHSVNLTTMADEEAIEKMKNDPKFRCFVKCVMNKSGFVSETGELNEDTVKKNVAATSLSDDDMKNIKECTDKQKQEDICERITEIGVCIYDISEKKE